MNFFFFQVYLSDAFESDYKRKSRFINFQFVYIVLWEKFEETKTTLDLSRIFLKFISWVGNQNYQKKKKMSNMLVGMWNVEVFEMWGRKIHVMQGQVMDSSPGETEWEHWESGWNGEWRKSSYWTPRIALALCSQFATLFNPHNNTVRSMFLTSYKWEKCYW